MVLGNTFGDEPVTQVPRRAPGAGAGYAGIAAFTRRQQQGPPLLPSAEIGPTPGLPGEILAPFPGLRVEAVPDDIPTLIGIREALRSELSKLPIRPGWHTSRAQAMEANDRRKQLLDQLEKVEKHIAATEALTRARSVQSQTDTVLENISHQSDILDLIGGIGNVAERFDIETERQVREGREELARLNDTLMRYKNASPLYNQFVQLVGDQARENLAQAQTIIHRGGIQAVVMMGQSNSASINAIRTGFDEASVAVTSMVLDSLEDTPQTPITKAAAVEQATQNISELEEIALQDLATIQAHGARIAELSEAAATAQLNAIQVVGESQRRLAQLEMSKWLQQKVYDVAIARDVVERDLDDFIADRAQDRQTYLDARVNVPGLYVSAFDYTVQAGKEFLETSPTFQALNLDPIREAEIDNLLFDYIELSSLERTDLARNKLATFLTEYGLGTEEALFLVKELDFTLSSAAAEYDDPEFYDPNVTEWDFMSPELARLIYEAAIEAGYEPGDAIFMSQNRAVHRLLTVFSEGDVNYKAELGSRQGLAGLPFDAYQTYSGGTYIKGSAQADAIALMKVIRYNFGMGQAGVEAALDWLLNNKEWGTLPPGFTK